MLATEKLVAVHAWPQSVQLAVDELRSDRAMTVISVPSPVTTNRLLARDLVRAALRQTLAAFLCQPLASITLVSLSGQAIRVDSPLAHLHLSVSHMPGMSVAAISRGAAIGVDVMLVERDAAAMPDWARVALDYLGPAVSDRLQRTPPAQRPAAFAQAWTNFEACLKCLDLGLTEWTPVLAQQLATCRDMPLDLPENCRGAIAINGNAVMHGNVSPVHGMIDPGL